MWHRKASNLHISEAATSKYFAICLKMDQNDYSIIKEVAEYFLCWSTNQSLQLHVLPSCLRRIRTTKRKKVSTFCNSLQVFSFIHIYTFIYVKTTPTNNTSSQPKLEFDVDDFNLLTELVNCSWDQRLNPKKTHIKLIISDHQHAHFYFFLTR